MDMSKWIAAKSDQLNSDDLLGGPRTITITSVRGTDASDQPVAVHFEGDGNKPFKPCKTMLRAMVKCWGKDAATYAGKSMTLYCDPEVQFGGMKVGGIRISHMSHIDGKQVMALTATRGKKASYVVHPLDTAPKQQQTVDHSQTLTRLRDIARPGNLAELQDQWQAIGPEARKALAGELQALKDACAAPQTQTDPGDVPFDAPAPQGGDDYAGA
jgi:hypothetical protein